MTPRNPLDDKVIVDRNILEEVFRYRGNYSSATLQALEQALAQDNTGWCATREPFSLDESTPDNPMLNAAAEWYRENGFYERRGFYESVNGLFRAMLAASPPLGGGKE